MANLKAVLGVVNNVAFSPDGKSLVAGDYEGSVVLWDLTSKAARARRRGHQLSVTSLAFSPDGKRFATASKDNDIKLWDTATGDEVAHYKEGPGSGWADASCYAAFAPSGRAIFSVSEMKVRLRDLETGKITAIRELSLGGRKLYVEKMVFSPDCKTLAGVCWQEERREVEDGSVVLWDIAALIQTGAQK